MGGVKLPLLFGWGKSAQPGVTVPHEEQEKRYNAECADNAEIAEKKRGDGEKGVALAFPV